MGDPSVAVAVVVVVVITASKVIVVVSVVVEFLQAYSTFLCWKLREGSSFVSSRVVVVVVVTTRTVC